MILLLYNNIIGKCARQNRIKIRRGIASVVTQAIILSAVSIIGVMLLAWSNSSMLQQQMVIEDAFNTQLNKINEDLIFENVWFALASPPSETANHLNVTITNTGTLGFNVTEIHVTDVTGNNNDLSIYPLTNEYILKSDSLSLNITHVWSSGDELDLLVLTNRGNQFVTQVVAP